jgi:hypothetical protein
MHQSYVIAYVIVFSTMLTVSAHFLLTIIIIILTIIILLTIIALLTINCSFNNYRSINARVLLAEVCFLTSMCSYNIRALCGISRSFQFDFTYFIILYIVFYVDSNFFAHLLRLTLHSLKNIYSQIILNIFYSQMIFKSFILIFKKFYPDFENVSFTKDFKNVSFWNDLKTFSSQKIF